MTTREENIQTLHEELLLFKERLDKDLEKSFFLTILDHIYRFNCFLPEINKLSPRFIYKEMNDNIYFRLNEDRANLIKQGRYNQEYSSILSSIASRVDFWIQL